MRTLTTRADAEVEQALESLTRDGQSRSEATRAAILEAERAHRRTLRRRGPVRRPPALDVDCRADLDRTAGRILPPRDRDRRHQDRRDGRTADRDRPAGTPRQVRRPATVSY